MIADEQTRRIDIAARDHELVIADTTALMTAVYSDWVFGDTNLYPSAQEAHSTCELTLLTSLDLAWQADGLQRDGPHAREPVDALIRAALAHTGVGYSVVAGVGAARLRAAVASVERAMAAPATAAAAPRWQWHCDRCGDAACERPSFSPQVAAAVCGSSATSLSSPEEKNTEIGGCPKLV